MKTLKLYAGSLILISIAVLSACGDNFTSLPEALNSNILISEKKAESEIWYDHYSSDILLQPGESIFLDSSITNIAGITDYSVSNCSNKELYISASNIESDRSLGCSWRTRTSFMLADLNIQNISNREKKITVKLNFILQ